MLNQRNANPMTPNSSLWLVESNEDRYEYLWETFSYAYLSNVKSTECQPNTPNSGLWLVESNVDTYEYWWETFSYAYLSNVKSTKLVMNIDENIFRMPIYLMLNQRNANPVTSKN